MVRSWKGKLKGTKSKNESETELGGKQQRRAKQSGC